MEEKKTVDQAPAEVKKVNPDFIDSVEALKAKEVRMRAAQKKFATYTQEQVDKIFYAAAMAANQARIPLAKMAFEETGMGVMEDKIIKNHYASEFIYHAYRSTKTCGVIAEDTLWGTKKIAEPLGLIAAIIPTTNPTSTAIFKTLIALKTRNAIIISPHPRAKKSTNAAAKLVLDAAVAAGAPEEIIGWIDEPSIELSAELMKTPDVILATGGGDMVTAAYSSGKPAIGVGPGNCAVIVDDTANVLDVVNSTIHSKTFDHGMICSTESTLIVLEKAYAAVKAEFEKRGGYFLKADEAKKVGDFFLINGGRVNPKIVGQSAPKIAELAGVKVPANTKVLIAEVTSTDPSEPFSHEKLSTLLGMYKAKSFDQALDMADEILHGAGGVGHTSALWCAVNEKEKQMKHQLRMQTCRLLVNQPTSLGGIGDIYNFQLTPSLTLGCGSYAGNSFGGQVGVENLLNIKNVAERRENMLWLITPEKIYFKKGCTQLALGDIKSEYNRKRAFIVTDDFLYNSGSSKVLEEELDRLGIIHQTYAGVAPDPTLQMAREGVKQLEAFKPDCIIAFGGGSSMDAAKIMWLMYEHPEEDFFALATVFMDIKKRIHKFPKMGQKAILVCVPTSAGTGSEVTPFAIITDADTGTKWPLADYELTPTMAIIDADNMMNMPKGLTASSGIDVLTHATEAFVSTFANDYTNGFALTAAKNVFDYLPRAFEHGANDEEARIKMADASALAGIAFANAFLGINHSMAHKLGAYHHLPHGVANAVLMVEVIKYQATETPYKMGTFSQYKYPQAVKRYADLARYCGFGAKDDQESVNNLIKKIEELKKFVGIKGSIKEYGIDEKYFLEKLDEMVEQAFNDECTGASPSYPRFEDLKQIYLKCYYGK